MAGLEVETRASSDVSAVDATPSWRAGMSQPRARLLAFGVVLVMGLIVLATSARHDAPPAVPPGGAESFLIQAFTSLDELVEASPLIVIVTPNGQRSEFTPAISGEPPQATGPNDAPFPKYAVTGMAVGEVLKGSAPDGDIKVVSTANPDMDVIPLGSTGPYLLFLDHLDTPDATESDYIVVGVSAGVWTQQAPDVFLRSPLEPSAELPTTISLDDVRRAAQ